MPDKPKSRERKIKFWLINENVLSSAHMPDGGHYVTNPASYSSQEGSNF